MAKKTYPNSKIYVYGLAVVVTLVATLLVHQYGLLGATTAPRPITVPSAFTSSSNPSVDPSGRFAPNTVYVRYPTTPTTLGKQYLYFKPAQFDALFFIYNRNSVARFVEMQVTVVKRGGDRQESSRMPIISSGFGATPLPEGGWMRGDLGRIIKSPVYPDVPESSRLFIERIEVTLSWRRPRSNEDSVMKDESTRAKLIQFYFAPAMMHMQPQVREALLTDMENVYSPSNR
jgi:hypothetical protein